MSAPLVPGRERDLWYRTYDWTKGMQVVTGGWPKFELICTEWEENAAGERRLIERRATWVDFRDADHAEAPKP